MKSSIASTAFIKDEIAHNGNQFLTGNGYFGIRGTLEEYTKENMCAINLAGVYDKVGKGWRESVNAPNPLWTYVLVDGELFSVLNRDPAEHCQALDIQTGIHSRKTVWHTEKGAIAVTAERFASMADQHLIGLKYSVSADFSCKIELVTGIDGDVWDINGPHFKTVTPAENGDIKTVVGITGEKEIAVTVGAVVCADFAAMRHTTVSDFSVQEHLCFTAEPGKCYTIEKIAAVTTTRDESAYQGAIEQMDYKALYRAHVDAWKAIWDLSYVEIDGDAEAEFALNYSIYHLNCVAPRNMTGRSIPARGLSGQVYKGAIFWDTEMFMIDYYLYTDPQIVKTLLMYRIQTLQGALDKAKSYGLEGAFYAWESQENGDDACSDYNIVDVFTKRPMRTYFRDKQVHVSAAIVYAIEKYVRITGDTDILKAGGSKVIYECAKFYTSLLLKYANKDYYEIHDVVGPDEYHERVNNNAYTNAMAKFVLETAARYADTKEGDADTFLSLAKQMKKPNVNENGVIEQFDGYFKLEDCTVDEVRSRLLDPKEYWGGANGVASDTQIIKQADVVAMLSVMPGDFTVEDMRTNLKYYEPRTEHGSSLSACMYSMLSCKVGDPEYAYPLFMKSAAVDMTKGGKQWLGLIYIGGTHPASEGGAWMVAIEGFAGMKIENGVITCQPCLPEKWQGMKFKIHYRGDIYQVKVTKTDWNVEKL